MTSRRGRPRKVREEKTPEERTAIDNIKDGHEENFTTTVVNETIRHAPPNYYYVEVRKGIELAEHKTCISEPVGTITYLESTDSMEWTYEPAYYEYMRSFVERDYQVINKETKTEKWLEKKDVKEWIKGLYEADIYGDYYVTKPVVKLEAGR